MLRQDDYVKTHLVTVGYNFGKEYGGHLAACMVMNTIANRVRLGWGSWLEVIDNIPKYAAVDEIPTGLPSIWDANFIRLLTEVEGIYEGSMKDYSSGALYWCDNRRVTREWFLEKIIRSGDHPVVANMNSLSFYR
jgi:hypothetical protein